MRRILPPLLALCLGVCASLLLACGNTDKLIPGDDASAIDSRLDRVKQLIDAGSCQQAGQAAIDVQTRVRALPQSVDERLRVRLREGAQALVDEATPDCLAGKTTETVPTTTEQTPTESVPTETTPPTTTEAPPTTTTAPPTDTTTTEVPPTTTGTGGASSEGTGTVTP